MTTLRAYLLHYPFEPAMFFRAARATPRSATEAPPATAAAPISATVGNGSADQRRLWRHPQAVFCSLEPCAKMAMDDDDDDDDGDGDGDGDGDDDDDGDV